MQRSTIALLIFLAACGTIEVPDQGGGGGGGNPAEAPTVASITPDRGPLAGGNEVTLSGTGFIPGITVIVGGIEAQAPTIESETSLTFVVPAGFEPETGVGVLVFGEAGFGELPQAYTYNVEPTVATVSATFGPLAGGTTLDITGEHFLTNNPGTPTVTIAGTEATDVQVLDDSTIRFTTAATPPDVVALPQDIVVSTGNGNATLEKAFSFVRAGLLFSSRDQSDGLAFGIYYFDIETQRSLKLTDVPGGVGRFFATGDGNVLVRLNRRTFSSSDWARVDLATGGFEFLGELTDSATNNSVRVPATTMTSPTTMLATTRSGTVGTINPQTMTFTNTSPASLPSGQLCMAAKNANEVIVLTNGNDAIQTFNIADGATSVGPSITGAFGGDLIPGNLICHGAAMVGPTLFALFNDQSTPSRVGHLVSINPATGVGTEIAVLPGGASELEPTPLGIFQ